MNSQIKEQVQGGKDKMEKKILKEPLIIGIVVIILVLILNMLVRIPEGISLATMLFGVMMILIGVFGGDKTK